MTAPFIPYTERHGCIQDDECPPEHQFGRHKSTPEIKARADAEWAAMDEFGRLPEGWSFTPSPKGAGRGQ